METRCFYAVITHKNIIQKRRMTVIDGQPFYESTGTYSGISGFWFPFVMLKGTIFPCQYSPELNMDSLKKIFSQDNYDQNYLIKYEYNVLATSHQDLKFNHVINGRIPNKNTLITSLRLSMQHNFFKQILLEYQNLLNQDEIKFILENPIKLQQINCSEIQVPDAINQTLIQMGAINIEFMLTEQLTQPIDDEPSNSSHSVSMWKPLQKALTTGNIIAYTKYSL